MNAESTFSFLTSQDEYHCFLERMLSRASKLYYGVTPNIEANLIDNYVQMEKACLKEEYSKAALYYIKQLEEIVYYGLNSVTLRKISDDLRNKVEEKWQLSPLGEEMLIYKRFDDVTKNNVFYKTDKNQKAIEKVEKGETLIYRDSEWTVFLNLYKHYFNVNRSTDFAVDTLLYYKRNLYAHGASFLKNSEEQKFEKKFYSPFEFLNLAQKNLKKYAEVLSLPVSK